MKLKFDSLLKKFNNLVGKIDIIFKFIIIL